MKNALNVDKMALKQSKEALESNIRKFYWYRVFCSLSFVSPIFVLFYLSNGLSMTQVMILQSIYTAVIMLAVIPSGVIADKIGRKKVLIVSSVLFTASWALFASGHSFGEFLVAEIIIALSSATWMATGTAFFYDTLVELKKQGDFKKLFGNVVGINYLALGVASLAGGYIATYGLRLPFWMVTVSTFLALLITFSFTEPKLHKKTDSHHLTHLKGAIKFTAHHPKVRLFIIYSAISLTIGFIGFMFYQPYLKSIKVPLVYFGLIYFAMYLLAAFGSRFAHLFAKATGEKKSLVILAVITTICFFGMSRNIVLAGFIFIIPLSCMAGLFETIISDYLNKYIESYHRATVLSLGTLLSQMFTTVASPFFGWMVDFWSLQTAFLMAGIILVINLVILVVAFKFIDNSENNKVKL